MFLQDFKRQGLEWYKLNPFDMLKGEGNRSRETLLQSD